jgi:hypothetical protein
MATEVGSNGSTVMAASPAKRESAYLSLSRSEGYLSAFPSNLFLSCARKGRSSLRLPVNFSGSGKRSDLAGFSKAAGGAGGSGFGVSVVDGFGVCSISARRVVISCC